MELAKQKVQALRRPAVPPFKRQQTKEMLKQLKGWIVEDGQAW